MRVSSYGPEVAFVLDEIRAIATEESRALVSMPLEPAIGVVPEKGLHASGQVGLWRLQHNVHVVGHHDERIDAPTATNVGPAKQVLQRGSVRVVARNAPWSDAAGHDVVNGVGIMDTRPA